ncbi:uncharacterized protein PAE49_018501 isoform 2-T2 [Odontesthes bonariensis]|uniref:uncharacterized protein LOC142402178 isoform X2 n=1 Tax=Odontesthes bonariensis TaxID=219752 RepID=UPI003F58CBEB
MCFGRFSSWPTVASSFRVKKPGSCVRCGLWLKMQLVVILLADHASRTPTSSVSAIFPSPTTACLTSGYYSLDVTVSVSGQRKNESEITAWLEQVFQNKLENCLFSNPEEIIAALKSPQTTSDGEGGSISSTNLHSINGTGSWISNHTSSPFQGMEVSCDVKTATSKTECLVTLKLSQTVPPCCILHTLCTASKNSSDIRAVGKKADRLSLLQNERDSDSEEESTCIYSGPLNGSCEESGPAYAVTQRNSTECAAGNNCSCSAHCSRPDAYYTFSISLNDSRINSSHISSLISRLKQPICNISSVDQCPLYIIASEYKDANVACTDVATNCDVVLGFARKVPICSVAEAVMNVFKSEEDISYNGKVQRAAICGNLENSDNPLQSQFKWVDSYLKPMNFCSEINESNITTCEKGKNVVVKLNNQCVVGMPTVQPNLTTLEPNVTTAQPNVTTVQPNVTTVQPNVTTVQPNVTTVQPNVTTAQPNVTTVQPNVTTAQPNVTTVQPNVTTVQPNVTTVQPNVTTVQPNVTTAQPNTTTAQPNVTTVQPNVTTVQPNVTTVQPNVTTAQPNVTTVQPNSTTLSVFVTSSTSNTTAVTATTQQNTTMIPNVITTTTESVSEISSKAPTANASAESQGTALLELTRDTSNLTSEQIDALVSQLESLLSGPNVSLELGNICINIVSNLLDASPEKLQSSSDRIIGITDTVGLKLVVGENAETLLSPALALSVKLADGTNFQESVFSISDPSNVQVRGDPRLKRSVMRDSSIPQGSIRLPPSLTETLTLEEQLLASRVQFNFYQKSTLFQDRSLGERQLYSGILAASVANLSIKGMKDRVVIQLRNTQPVPANFVTTCVFWDFTFNDGSGGWSSDGCIVQNKTEYETTCGCDHLTSFAILLDIDRDSSISRLQATILTFITFIGCGISAIFLSVTLLTYLAFGKLRKDIPSRILIHLCLALLLLNLTFLVDAWLALYPEAVGLCISTAWFLHYFLLVSFTWMGLEGVHMYLAIVKVFNSYISRYMLKFSLVGWGVPMIVVIIVIAIDKDNYGLVSYGKFTDGTSDEFCWLRNDVAFYVAVVAYYCVIFLFNFIMFIVVLVQMRRIRKQNPHNSQYRTSLQDVRSVVGITILLGLTWGFAFFAWEPVNLAFMYLFAIFNSLQGFFLFIFHCAVKENVRRQWKTYLCCGRMRLSENSEWSRTATQKTVKKGSLTKVTSLQSSNFSRGNNSSSSSSFLASESSEQINGISSPFEDRAITADEEPHTDVVLNELNRQHRNQQAS